MAKSIPAIAALCLALLTVVAAAGEMSYEGRGYGGPLGVGPNFHSSGSSSQEGYSPQRSSGERAHRAANKPKPAKEVDTAKTAPAKKEAENENSSIAGASLQTDKAGEQTAVDTETKPTAEPAPTTSTASCKRYFPSVGKTVSVPCE
jgi:hypothetical protein